MDAVRVSQRHLKEYRELWFSKNWGCAICGQPFSVSDNAAVDHDHATGIIRGCLHSTCNRTEGELRAWAKRLAPDAPEAFLIDLGTRVNNGSKLGAVPTRIAVWSHKGVTPVQFVVGLANYLTYHATARTRMIHPNFRFPNEGGNNDKKHTAASRKRKGWYRRKK